MKQNKAKVRRQISEIRQWPISSNSQTRQSSLVNQTIWFLQDQCRRGFKYYCARNTTVTSLVSSRTHA
jgi:hypothetical protein